MQNTSKITLKIISVVLLLWLFPYLSKAQNIDLNNYEGLYSKGEIPKIITKTIEKRILEGEKKHIDKNDNIFEKKAKQRSIVERSFVISELLLSGNVVFNDTLSGYIKLIARVLLKDDEETLKKLHFFVVKSPYPNSTSTEDGIILINTGLIARLKSEAQLAFFLAREIAHYKLKHQADLYLKTSQVDNNNSYNIQLIEENLLKHSDYPISQDLQADSMALSLYKNATYGGEELKNIFNVLGYEKAALEQIPFDLTFFNSQDFKIPSTYFFTQVNPIQEEHQNALLRISERNENINKHTGSKGNNFINNENIFYHCRDISRFELCSQYLKSREYSLAIYNSYILLKKYPNNSFLTSTIANSLYFLAKYKNANILLQVNDHYENVQGEQQQLFLLFSVIKQEELNVMAIQYLWKAYNNFPQRSDLKKKASELMYEMFKITSLTDNSFSRNSAPLDTNTSKTSAPEKGKMLTNKYYGFGKRPADTSQIKLNHAFASFFAQSEFEMIYTKGIKAKESAPYSLPSYFYNELKSYNPPANQPMQLNKIVMVDPSYFKINNTFFVEKFNALESEQARKEYSKSIKDISKKARLDVELLDSKFMNTKQVSLFNDLSRLNDFIHELYIHRDLDSLNSVDYQLINLLLEKHKTKYLGWNNVFALTEPDAMSDPVNFVMYSFYLPILIPAFLYDAITPDYYTYHHMMVADIERGKVIFNKSYLMIGKDTPDRLKSNLYYNFLQLGGKKKK